MRITAQNTSDQNLTWGASEPDTWALDDLDLEPESCSCLRCGKELPCSCMGASSRHVCIPEREALPPHVSADPPPDANPAGNRACQDASELEAAL